MASSHHRPTQAVGCWQAAPSRLPLVKLPCGRRATPCSTNRQSTRPTPGSTTCRSTFVGQIPNRLLPKGYELPGHSSRPSPRKGLRYHSKRRRGSPPVPQSKPPLRSSPRERPRKCRRWQKTLASPMPRGAQGVRRCSQNACVRA